MKKYKPIAVYHTAEDIISFFPCDRPKPDMGDIIYKRYKEGYGEPREISDPDEESYWDEKEIMEDNANFILTTDKKHGVRFTRGAMVNGVPMGYYIDIYELIDEDATEPEFTEAQLKLISRERRAIDSQIKQVIIKEFKEHFTEPGQGLDFFQYCPDDVIGYGVEMGTITKLVLGDDGKIYAWVLQEYEDSCEEFEDRYFGCDDWPQLLVNLRRGIKEGWTIEEDEEDDE